MFLEEKKLGPLVETKPESPELKVLRRARALIAKGWTQGANHRASWWGLRNSYCAIGAIRMAATGGPNRDDAFRRFGAPKIVENVVVELAKAAGFDPDSSKRRNAAMARPPRYLLRDGVTAVPGVTTILNRFKDSGGLIFWAWQQGKDGKDYRETKDRAAEAGTLAHAAAEAHIRGVDFPWPTDGDVAKKARTAFGAFLEWSKQTQLQVTHSEVSLVSERHKFGGTLDAMLIGGKRSLGDFKTSAGLYPDYLIQVAAYGILWEEHFPDMPIEGGYHVLRFDRDFGDFHAHWWSELETAKKAFLLMVELYSYDRELKARAK